MIFREALDLDLKNIVDIYNQAVVLGGSNADIEIQKVESKLDWFNDFRHPYFLMVCVIDSRVVGWCSISPYRKGRKGLAKTAEISYYLDNDYKGQGIGKQLILFSIEKAKENGFKNLLAIMLDVNELSKNILLKFGFDVWGHFPDIVEFENYSCGQFVMGKNISI